MLGIGLALVELRACPCRGEMATLPSSHKRSATIGSFNINGGTTLVSQVSDDIQMKQPLSTE